MLFRGALALRRDHWAARNGLARVPVVAEAVRLYREVLRMDPENALARRGLAAVIADEAP